jgi:hypothetical protein
VQLYSKPRLLNWVEKNISGVAEHIQRLPMPVDLDQKCHKLIQAVEEFANRYDRLLALIMITDVLQIENRALVFRLLGSQHPNKSMWILFRGLHLQHHQLRDQYGVPLTFISITFFK